MLLSERSAVALIPREPMLAWVQGLDPEASVTLAELERDPNVYLLPTAENAAGLEELLLELAEPLFVKELEAWSSDEDAWPVDRSPAALSRWFRLVHYVRVFDAVPDDPMFDDSEVLHAR